MMKSTATRAAKKTQSRSTSRRTGKSALLVLSVLFAVSASVRVASGTGSAIAREISSLRDIDQVDAGTQESCAPDRDMAAVWSDLNSREELLNGREIELAIKEKSLEVARDQVASNIIELTKAEERLSATISIAKTAAEDDLSRLTSVYESMKPKEASALFAQMPPDFSAGFIARMRADSAASIMAGLPPEVAFSVSVILAGRNANVPTE